MNQRTFLGLTHNPFSPPREGFFNGADRKTHLDHLRHLSQWSRRVLVVTGPFGIGKSTLFKELSASLEANTKGARLSGAVVSTEREVLTGLLQGFGVGGELDGHADDLSAIICAHAEEQESHDRVCMVMVDDAHLLEAGALQRIVHLVADSPIRVVLFGEAGVVPNLDRAAKKSELEWFEIRLTGFPKTDVRDYLEWRFRQAQYRGLLPFTDEQLDKIVARSGGNPSVVDSMANRLLADMESGEIRKQGTGFPLRHAVLAGVLVLMVGLIYVFVQPEEPVEVAEVDRTQTTADTEVGDALQSPAPAVDEVIVGARAEDSTQTSSSGPEDPIFVDELPVEDAPQESLDTELGRDVEQDVDEVLLASESASADASGLEVGGEVSPPAEALATAVEETSSATEDEVRSVDEPVSEPIAASPVPVIESVAADAPSAAPSTPPTTPPSTPQTPAAIYRDADWILEQDSTRFTMQLFSLSSLERAEAFIQRQDDPGEFALYRMQRDGRSLFVITYGVFSSKEAAAAVADSFSGELAGVEPWIRPLGLVQNTVRANTQN